MVMMMTHLIPILPGKASRSTPMRILRTMKETPKKNSPDKEETTDRVIDRDDSDKEDTSHKDTEYTEDSSNRPENESGAHNDDSGSIEGDSTDPLTAVYTRFPQLHKIYEFQGGLAAFTISSGILQSNIGFINEKGDVVIEPLYGPSSNSYYFGNGCCIQVYEENGTKKNYYIIDKQGHILFEVGKNKVTNLGAVQNGYFWVETMEAETIAGTVYQVVYYSQTTLEPIVVFENMRAETTFFADNASNVGTDGSAILRQYRSSTAYTEITINMKDYDPHFGENLPASSTAPTVQLEEIPEFQGAKKIVGYAYGVDDYSAVYIQSPSDTDFYAIVDRNGTVTMQPQKEIGFHKYSYFRHNLCPAYDITSNLWGYVDPEGTWIIQPQYASATYFSEEGLATVNDNIVIDTAGRVVIAPAGWGDNQIEYLTGTYQYQENDYWIYTIAFYQDGTIKCHFDISTHTGTYQIIGQSIVVDINFPAYSGFPVFKTKKEYGFTLNGNELKFGGKIWTRLEDSDF